MMGNRIYGCDDCQLVCPWNKFAKRSALPDFDERHGLGSAQLTRLMSWNEAEFLHFTQGSAIRRIGHVRWLRNIAVAMGNALRASPPPEQAQSMREVLQSWASHDSEMLREHIHWALADLT